MDNEVFDDKLVLLDEQTVMLAEDFAFRTHNGHFRKGNSQLPYLSHCYDVLNTLKRWKVVSTDNAGRNALISSAALLHDYIEESDDPAASIGAIAIFFPKAVFGVVDELTWDKDVLTKQEYIESFKLKSIEALVIKVADRICNIRDFELDGNPYWIEYTKKGRPVFDAFTERSNEFISSFGGECYLRVQADIAKLIYDFTKHSEWTEKKEYTLA